MAARDRSRTGSTGGWSTGYPDLDRAIAQASGRYQVPPDLLAGIWRVESGSTYPNPAINSSGFGGLFGTTDAFGPTQQQADLAASILSNGLRASNGDIGEALSYYNTGKLSGGYTTVPGETTFGNVKAPTGGPVSTAVGGRGPRPSGGGGIGGFLGGLGHTIANPFEQGWGAISGGIGDVVGFLKAAAWLVDPRNWLRAVEVFAGFALILVGIIELAKAADAAPSGAAASVGNAVGLVPAGRALKGLKGAQTARKVKQGKRAAAAASEADRSERRETDRIVRGHRETEAAHRARRAKASADVQQARATRERRKTRAGKPSERARRAAAQRKAEQKRGVDIFGAPL